MHDDPPAPMTPADSDLRDFPHTPLFRSRLFGSSFHAQANDAEWRAGVTLWLKSWDQVPAGSLPDNDIELCRLAELARDTKTWKKLKEGAMRGWVACADGRLYHPVVAEGVNTAIEAKVKQRLKTAKARIAALEKHLATASTDDDKARMTDEIRKLQQTMSQGLSQTLSQRPREGEEKEKEKEKGLNIYTPLPPKGAGRGRSDPDEEPDGFAAWYALYRRKDAKRDAIKAWRALGPDEALQARMAAALRAWKWSDDRTKIPLPASWLRGRRWEDESVAKALPLAGDGQAWFELAGFDNAAEALNARCHAGNFQDFRDGKLFSEETHA